MSASAELAISNALRPARSDARTGGREPRRQHDRRLLGRRGAVRPADRGERLPGGAVDREQRRRGAAKRRDDAEFKRVARQHASAAVARLELERDDGDRIDDPCDERNCRRLGSKRGRAALAGEAPIEPRALRQFVGACEPHRNIETLAGANRRAGRPRDDEPRPLKVGQPVGESARAVLNVQKAVRFPLSIVELGNDIAGDRPLPAQRLDLALERPILEVLRRADEAVEVAEDRLEPGVPKAGLDPMRVGAAQVPVVSAFEPPRFAAVRRQELARMRQSPDAELRADQRLIAAPLGVAMRREGPGRPGREGARRRRERLVLVGEAVIPVEILDVGLEVIIAREAGRIVDEQALGDERLHGVEGLDQPPPVVRIVVEIDPPPLVEERPYRDRGMMAVGRDGGPEHPSQRLARRRRQELHVGHVEPDDESKPVGEIEIEPVRNLDVAAQRVQSHRLGAGEALLEKLGARRAAFLLGMPVLIEGAEHGEGLSIQDEASVLGLEPPEPDRPFRSIDDPTLMDDFDREIIEVGRIRRPRVRIGDFDLGFELRRTKCEVVLRHRLS